MGFDIFAVDTLILSDKAKWADTKLRYQKSPHSTMEGKTPISSANHLVYVRALSRVLVDIMTSQWNEGREEASKIQLIAAGSTSITSDYDVTLVGNGASKLSKSINDTFLEQTEQSLSLYADTNLYTTPCVYLTEDRAVLIGKENLILFADPTKTAGLNIYCLKPTLSNGGESASLTAAVNRLLKAQDKITSPLGTGDVYATCSVFEHLMYDCPQPEWTTIWQIVVEALQLVEDAYHSVATICVVVVEMQMRKEVDQGFSASIYMAAAIENLAELTEYAITEKSSDLEVVNTMKYTYRSLYSLQRALSRGTKEKTTLLTTLLSGFLTSTRAANTNRSNAGFTDSQEFHTYRRNLQTMLATITNETRASVCRNNDQSR
jgi:hypothetical protein